VSTIEELLGRNSNGSSLETEVMTVGIRHADHVTTSTRKRWRQAAVSRLVFFFFRILFNVSSLFRLLKRNTNPKLHNDELYN
jgi:hypothetical protein